jgi:hypothetical protein
MPTHPNRPADSRRDEAPAPGRLWRQLPPERRRAGAEAFWQDPEGAEQHAEALAWMARQLNFRLKSLQKLPTERKIRYFTTLGGVPDSVAVRALVAYHLHGKREMMSAFLDQLGIPHDNGVISAEHLAAPEPGKLAEAAKALAAAYSRPRIRTPGAAWPGS